MEGNFIVLIGFFGKDLWYRSMVCVLLEINFILNVIIMVNLIRSFLRIVDFYKIRKINLLLKYLYFLLVLIRKLDWFCN